jgi:hypothetical protein
MPWRRAVLNLAAHQTMHAPDNCTSSCCIMPAPAPNIASSNPCAWKKMFKASASCDLSLFHASGASAQSTCCSLAVSTSLLQHHQLYIATSVPTSAPFAARCQSMT